MAYVCNSQRELGSRRFVLSVAGNLLFKYVWLYRFHTKPWRSFRESANTKRQTRIVHHPKQIFCCANLTGNVLVMSFLYCVEERPVIGNCAGSNSVGSASHEPRGNVVGRSVIPFSRGKPAAQLAESDSRERVRKTVFIDTNRHDPAM